MRTSHRIPLTFRILANHQLNHSKQIHIQTNIHTYTYISISSNHPIIQLVYKKTILYIYIYFFSFFSYKKKTITLTSQPISYSAACCWHNNSLRAMLRLTILLLVLVVAVTTAAATVQVLLLLLPWRCKRRQQGRRSHFAVANVNDCEPRLSVRFLDVEFCGRRL